METDLETLTHADLTECFSYLDRLRESGVTNMFGAAPYLEEHMGIEIKQAREVLWVWMHSDLDQPADTRATAVIAARTPATER